MRDNPTDTNGEVSLFDDAHPHRRGFLQAAGGAVGAAALFISGCDTPDEGPSDAGRDADDVGRDAADTRDAADARDARDAGDGVLLDFSSDVGVLNYAYALEQLESAFYAMVVAESFDEAITDEDEQLIFTDLEAHETIHSQFYAEALGDDAIGELEVDFSSVDFDDRESVIATAQTFEDLGVAAYNGAGIFLSDPNLLEVAGKIVSVEARHAAAVRDLTVPSDNFFGGGSEGDFVIDEQGLDRAFAPSDVLEAAGSFITTPIELTNVPSST